MAHRLNIGPTTPAECGSADAYYSGGRWYGYKPHCYNEKGYVPDCDMTAEELRDLNDALSKIEISGDRYPAEYAKRTGN